MMTRTLYSQSTKLLKVCKEDCQDFPQARNQQRLESPLKRKKRFKERAGTLERVVGWLERKVCSPARRSAKTKSSGSLSKFAEKKSRKS